MGILKEEDFLLEPYGCFFFFFEDGKMLGSGSKVSSDVRCWDGIFFPW